MHATAIRCGQVASHGYTGARRAFISVNRATVYMMDPKTGHIYTFAVETTTDHFPRAMKAAFGGAAGGLAYGYSVKTKKENAQILAEAEAKKKTHQYTMDILAREHANNIERLRVKQD